MKFSYLKLCIAFAVLFFSGIANAKKFNFKSAGLAPYVRGTFGTSKLGNEAYAKSSGTQSVFNEHVPYNYSGEFGVLLAFGAVNVKLGAEILFPRTLSGIEAKDASGNKLFEMDSKLLGITPMGSLEYVYKQRQESKFIVGAGYGISYITLENIYRMTDQGTTTYGLPNHTEASKATVPTYEVYTGWEFLFTDNVTLTMELGYRYLLIPSLTYKTDLTTFTGTHTAGATVVNNDNSTRSLDISGPFIGLSFRFYLL